MFARKNLTIKKERKQTFLPLCRLVLNLLLSYDTYFYSLIYRSLIACTGIRSDVSVELDIFNLPADTVLFTI